MQQDGVTPGDASAFSRMVSPAALDSKQDVSPIPPKFVEALTEALEQRRVAEGIALLEGVDLSRLSADCAKAADLLLLIAQWVDIGYRDHHFLEVLLGRFPAESRRFLSAHAYLRVRMVEAFVALALEEVDAAIEILELVLKTARDLNDEALAALAHFWKGRAHRKKGEYQAALEDIVRARELAEQSKDAMFTAVIQIQESWLLFQKGMRKEAQRMLASAEAVLKGTDHYIALGNIESAKGRMVRRSGEYAKALEHFDRSIRMYAKGDGKHRNLARALVNAAYVRRLLALQLRKRIEAPLRASGGTAAKNSEQKPGGREALRARYEEICQEAILALKHARRIYRFHAHTGGLGNVFFNLGYLHLDRGDIDRAASEASQAYRLGQEKHDHILMARARILQAATENAQVEEQMGEDVDVAVHAGLARDYSEEALTLARNTQNRRLLAGACLARGTTAADDFFQDWELARRYVGEASELIGLGENDHLAEELATLKAKVVQASGIHDTLRTWSEGMVGNKTFQQITEEFAEIVIPKVWLREDRKISRVAKCLSISPKKVRRILRNAGLMAPE